jgi:hypothetical protein
VKALILGLAAVFSTATPSDAASNVPDWHQVRQKVQPYEVQFYIGFASCVATYWPRQAQALLASLPGSPAEREAIAPFANVGGYCVLRGAVRMKSARVRGALAEAFLRTNRAPQTPIVPVGLEETFDSFSAKLLSASAGAVSDDEDRSSMIGRWAAYCAVRKNSASVTTLLRTRQTSRQERNALNELNPVFAGCLPKDEALRVNPSYMRAYLAEALYWHRFRRGGNNA